MFCSFQFGCLSDRRADPSIHLNKQHAGESGLGFFRVKKIIGRTETRTRDRMYLGRIRKVTDIPRCDRAIIATCSLRTPTDRLKANNCVDVTMVVSLARWKNIHSLRYLPDTNYGKASKSVCYVKCISICVSLSRSICGVHF